MTKTPRRETVGANIQVPQLGQSSDEADKLIEELREAISARDDFLAVATHELRNPLTPILLCLQLIRTSEETKDHAKVMHELDRLERQIKHFIARANILLEVGQIASGKFHLDPSKLNLSELIAEVVNDYMPLAVRSGSALSVSVQNGVVAVLDRTAVSGIAENLLANEIKHEAAASARPAQPAFARAQKQDTETGRSALAAAMFMR